MENKVDVTTSGDAAGTDSEEPEELSACFSTFISIMCFTVMIACTGVSVAIAQQHLSMILFFLTCLFAAIGLVVGILNLALAISKIVK